MADEQKAFLLEAIDNVMDDNILAITQSLFMSGTTDDPQIVDWVYDFIKSQPLLIQENLSGNHYITARLKKIPELKDASFKDFNKEQLRVFLAHKPKKAIPIEDILSDILFYYDPEYQNQESEDDFTPQFSLNKHAKEFLNDYYSQAIFQPLQSYHLYKHQEKEIIETLISADPIDKKYLDFIPKFLNALPFESYKNIFSDSRITQLIAYDKNTAQHIHLSEEKWAEILNQEESSYQFPPALIKRFADKFTTTRLVLPCGVDLTIPLEQVAKQIRIFVDKNPLNIDLVNKVLRNSSGVTFIVDNDTKNDFVGTQRAYIFTKTSLSQKEALNIYNQLLTPSLSQKEVINLLQTKIKFGHLDKEISQFKQDICDRLVNLLNAHPQAFDNFITLIDKTGGLLFTPRNHLIDIIEATQLKNQTQSEQTAFQALFNIPLTHLTDEALDYSTIRILKNDLNRQGLVMHELFHSQQPDDCEYDALLNILINETETRAISYLNVPITTYPTLHKIYLFRYKQAQQKMLLQIKKNKQKALTDTALSPAQREKLKNWRLTKEQLQRIAYRKCFIDFIGISLSLHKLTNPVRIDSYYLKNLYASNILTPQDLSESKNLVNAIWNSTCSYIYIRCQTQPYPKDILKKIRKKLERKYGVKDKDGTRYFSDILQKYGKATPPYADFIDLVEIYSGWKDVKNLDLKTTFFHKFRLSTTERSLSIDCRNSNSDERNAIRAFFNNTSFLHRIRTHPIMTPKGVYEVPSDQASAKKLESLYSAYLYQMPPVLVKALEKLFGNPKIYIKPSGSLKMYHSSESFQYYYRPENLSSEQQEWSNAFVDRFRSTPIDGAHGLRKLIYPETDETINLSAFFCAHIPTNSPQEHQELVNGLENYHIPHVVLDDEVYLYMNPIGCRLIKDRELIKKYKWGGLKFPKTLPVSINDEMHDLQYEQFNQLMNTISTETFKKLTSLAK